MISWQTYLTTMVDTFRKNYNTLTEGQKAVAQLNTTFSEPCQIEVFSFKKPRRDMLLVSFDPKRPDKEFVIHDEIGIDAETYVSRRAQSDNIFRKHKKGFSSTLTRKVLGTQWENLTKRMSVYYFDNLRKQHPDPKIFAYKRFMEVHFFTRENVSRMARLGQYAQLSREVDKLKTQLKQISDENLRSSALSTTEGISSRITEVKKIDEHEKRIEKIEQDIGGVRKIIGVTKEFQDWRILVSDVNRLKGEHVPKEVFESEIKRLEDKIKGTNTRIEDLKAIKFWSKRTLLEIALGIWGAIITLYAAGILKL